MRVCLCNNEILSPIARRCAECLIKPAPRERRTLKEVLLIQKYEDDSRYKNLYFVGLEDINSRKGYRGKQKTPHLLGVKEGTPEF